MDEDTEDPHPISLPSADKARRASLGLQAVAKAQRSELLRLLRQTPAFIAAVQKLVRDGKLYRVLVSKENAALVREGADGLVRPWLRRRGRFVENVNLVPVPPDIAGAVAALAIQAALAEIFSKLDLITNGVGNLAALIAQANSGGLQGAMTALEALRKLNDRNGRRDQVLAASAVVLTQLGTVIGQMRAHIQQMPPEGTGFFEGWDADWEKEATTAYERVRGDFAMIAKGMRCVLGSYWELGEFRTAQVAFERISDDLDAAGLAAAAQRARLLPYGNEDVAPERVFAQFIAARPSIGERLRGMTNGASQALEAAFSYEEIMK